MTTKNQSTFLKVFHWAFTSLSMVSLKHGRGWCLRDIGGRSSVNGSSFECPMKPKLWRDDVTFCVKMVFNNYYVYGGSEGIGSHWKVIEGIGRLRKFRMPNFNYRMEESNAI
ncbi:hypothetical protein Cflav_PD0273 [Pedosphaera parvula Ellin514]|uniref:Uncharacterized protein n=1 Tax=Pedosphaera parvula (strain Ellin514) TaxID=320771 RepID=B9XRW9_PEDPL|nr:hypothetical protein Cflav_PD0273 [Pedosphaera parvula Ellin514]